MKYATGTAFRRALEDRLRAQSLSSGAALGRLRKLVAFERLLARLGMDSPGAWVLKGGLGLELRLPGRARTTKDMDLWYRAQAQEVHGALVRAAQLELDDWFSFEVAEPGAPAAAGVQARGGARFPVRALVDGRTFEEFHVDVGAGDPILAPPQGLRMHGFLEFAGIRPPDVLCYPMVQQIAEKVHAYTRPRASGEPTRVKDLVDIVLLAELEALDAASLGLAMAATFDAAGTHPIPARLPDPPQAWAGQFRHLASEAGLKPPGLDEAMLVAERLLDPVLAGRRHGRWDPDEVAWKD